jgi:hypothetical protein
MTLFIGRHGWGPAANGGRSVWDIPQVQMLKYPPGALGVSTRYKFNIFPKCTVLRLAPYMLPSIISTAGYMIHCTRILNA